MIFIREYEFYFNTNSILVLKNSAPFLEFRQLSDSGKVLS